MGASHEFQTRSTPQAVCEQRSSSMKLPSSIRKFQRALAADMSLARASCSGDSAGAQDEVGSQAEKSTSWVHYQHEDGLDSYRWDAKECHQYLEDRSWAEVLMFYSLVAAGKTSLSNLTFHESSQFAGSHPAVLAKDQVIQLQEQDQVPEQEQEEVSDNVPNKPVQKRKGGKWDRKTFKIVLSYDGSAFIGWQRQPGQSTVQGLLEQALGSYSDGKRVASLRMEGLTVDAALLVAGRTDKGVHAAGQVCSFYTWRLGVTSEDIKASINLLNPRALRAISVNEVFRTFHPNFSARWRRYVYLLPIRSEEIDQVGCLQQNKTESGIPTKPATFDVMAVSKMLSKLEGQTLSYTVFARDTKTSRSRGPATECFMYHARAALAELPLMTEQCGGAERKTVMCVELVANRFLRKMVRVLVATSIREAAVGAPSNSLVRLLTAGTSRRASAPPAPACGLCLAEVGYDNFSQANLLIKRY